MEPRQDAACATRSAAPDTRRRSGPSEASAANSRIVKVRFNARGASSRTRDRRSRVAVITRSASVARALVT